MRIMAHVDKVHFASIKINSLFIVKLWYPNVLKTWQWSTPKSGNLKWVNNGCKSESVL